MNTNPYEPPNSSASDTQRVQDSARKSVRMVLLILLVPGLANLVLFHFFLVKPVSSFPQAHAINLGLNVLGTALVAFGGWFFGLQLFEFCTGGLHTVFAKKSTLNQWLVCLYEALSRGPALAFCGAIVWGVWLIGIHLMDIPFMTMSIPVGIAGHLFAAAFYIPLVRNWHRIEKEAQHAESA